MKLAFSEKKYKKYKKKKKDEKKKENKFIDRFEGFNIEMRKFP